MRVSGKAFCKAKRPWCGSVADPPARVRNASNKPSSQPKKAPTEPIATSTETCVRLLQ